MEPDPPATPEPSVAHPAEERALERAREQEQAHRALQGQGEAGGEGDDRTPVQRERDDAVDHAMEDVERAEREAAARASDPSSGRR